VFLAFPSLKTADVALDPILVGLAGVEWVTGIGLNRSFTLLYPEAIILDDELYHRARYALMDMEVSPETVALEVIQAVGPGGHFLAQKHTRRHVEKIWIPELSHPRLSLDGEPLPDIRSRVRLRDGYVFQDS
jgi:trimethylamine--corrinoid protein Co-methyltransferase